MSVATVIKNSFLSAFDRFEAARVGVDPPWLAPVRKAAIARFAELGIPTLRHEDRFPYEGAPLCCPLVQFSSHHRQVLATQTKIPETKGDPNTQGHYRACEGSPH